MAGRITLAKSVINNIPVFHMQVERLSAWVHKVLDKMTRRCVWGYSTLTKKIHLINLDTLCKPKEFGGAGLKKANIMNLALLAKLGWMLMASKEENWCRVLRSKCDVQEVDGPHFKIKQRSTLVWKGITWGSELPKLGMRWKAGDGRLIKF